jgi:hypothetical protein
MKQGSVFEGALASTEDKDMSPGERVDVTQR